MKKRLIARLAWTATASPLLMMLAYELVGTRFEALALPFSAPGLMVASAILRLAGQAGNAELHIQVAFGLNFVFIWIAVLIVVEWIERFMPRKRS
jgi:hypothetical protein